MTEGNKDQTDVERLLALSGPRDAVPPERLERMRAAVHDAWTEETKPRSNARLRWTLVTAAAAAAIIIAIMQMPKDAGIKKPTEAPAFVAANQIKTGPSERRSLILPRGGELRVDTSSVVTIAAGGEIHISKGAIYLDSLGTTLPTVITPAGRITDIGTRFEVRLVAGDTRVRVRDGKVRLAQPRAVNEVQAAEELLARADVSTMRRHVDPFGDEWAWVARAAPRFDLEDKSLGTFLDWIEREGAWTVAFASPALERSARSTVLHGSVESMSTTEALEAILPACGLAHHVNLKTGRVTVAAEGPAGPEKTEGPEKQ
jgi:ferric-dicitrate binding protein FerR (iron transport regulator)